MNTGSPGRGWFFVSIAVILLVIVGVGFTKSFYLRSVLSAGHATRLPAYIVVHGVVLTLWFLLFFCQNLLASSGRVQLHRSLGVAGVVLAAALFGLSMLVVVRSVVRETPLVVIGDIAILILFAVLITAGVRFRRKPEIHKRLMTVASISIVAPAIARWPGAQSMLPFSVLLPQLALFGAQVVHDFRVTRRLHPATAWGVASYMLASGVTVSLASSRLGHTLVNSLR